MCDLPTKSAAVYFFQEKLRHNHNSDGFYF
jgi:hypothetical protein